MWVNFYQNGTHKEHLNKHTGEKPYSYLKYDFKCLRKGNIKVHKTYHTGEKIVSLTVMKTPTPQCTH